jgi:hypothetical protein
MDVGAGSGLTIEAWIYSTDNTYARPIVEWVPKTVGEYGLHFNAHANGPGVLYANLYDTADNHHFIQTATGLVQTNVYQHVALTYDKVSGVARLFVNGALATESVLGTFTPQTSPDLSIGFRPNTVPFGPIPFIGLIDEVSIYSRALLPAEVQSIYNAGSAGKCFSAPPSIFAQPTNQAVVIGATAIFNVLVSGSQPLSYQWTMEGTNLPGATNGSLVLTNVQLIQAGTYTVQVTNSYGSIVSSNALLIVNPPPPCLPPPSGLVGWWRGEGNPADIAAGNNGTVTTGISFVPGFVGQAFNFDGVTGAITVPASVVMNVQNLTIETWIFPTDVNTPRPIFEFADPTGLSTLNFWYGLGNGAQPVAGALFASARDGVNPSGNAFYVASTGLLPANQWSHVAFTFDSVAGKTALFLNGVSVAASDLAVPVHPNTLVGVNLGYRPAGSSEIYAGFRHSGKLDEVSLYNRALSPSEIQAIYNAGMSGKCRSPIAAAIFLQPTNQTTTVGQTASFRVQAGGTWPLGYQWSFNGASIPGATSSTLVLTNVQMKQAGSYAVAVTNDYGSATSSNATLVVNFGPAGVNVVTASGTAGEIVTVPIVLVANGNENSLGFSLNFSPSLLTNAGVILGPGANGALLQYNTNQSGAVGVAIALPSGNVFAPGTQEVAEVSFTTGVSANPLSIPLSLSDQPITRQLADVNAHSLAANFTGGQIVLARSAFEADVAPRPDGDGTVTIVDWVQVGRYVAGLDVPGSASEFQRADCAPRSTQGDGLLTVSDWVQAGRYAAALDPLTVAGGPTTPSGGQAITHDIHKRGAGPDRILEVQGPFLFQGQSGDLVVNLEAQGNENAIGFSLAFDPTSVRYLNYTQGLDAADATMDVNANQATNGQLGIILALPTDVTFNPGTRELVKVNFQAIIATPANSLVTLTDLPVRREVADTNALPVVVTYSNGTILVNPKPSLNVNQTKQGISLIWPSWATNYTLQVATGITLPVTTWFNLPIAPTISNGLMKVDLQLNGSVQFYRLKHQ